MNRKRHNGFTLHLRVTLLLAVLFACGAWTVQWLIAYPVQSVGSSATAGILVLGLLLAALGTPFAMYRLIRTPSSRTAMSYTLTCICFVLLLIALLTSYALLAGV